MTVFNCYVSSFKDCINLEFRVFACVPILLTKRITLEPDMLCSTSEKNSKACISFVCSQLPYFVYCSVVESIT